MSVSPISQARPAAVGHVAGLIPVRRGARVWLGVCLAALLAWSLLPLILIAARSLNGQGAITGAFGLHPADQYQYMSWIRQAGEHGLIANRMDVGPAGQVFLHPMFLLSGLLWRAGVSLPLAFLVWSPVSTLLLFAGFRAYVIRWFGEDRRAAAAALVLALLFSVPLVTLINHVGLLSMPSRVELGLTSADVFVAGLTWGYPATAIAIGAMAFAVLGIERIVESYGPGMTVGRPSWGSVAWTSAAAGLMSWLHPWQGATLVLMIALLAAWSRLHRPSWPLLIVAGAAAMPIVYYWILTRIDAASAIAQRQNSWPWPPIWTVAVALAPLALCALFGVSKRPSAVGERLLILWPLAALATYVLVPAYPFHAMNGVTLPLAVLAARGWPRVTRLLALRHARWRSLVTWSAIGVVCLPGMFFSCGSLLKALRSPAPNYLHTSGQRHALDWLQTHGSPGGVASEPDLGQAVPVFTDRPSWLSHPVWTRDYSRRDALITRILAGKLRPDQARRALLGIQATYLMLGCGDRLPAADLPVTARPAAHFGCVRIYELRERARQP